MLAYREIYYNAFLFDCDYVSKTTKKYQFY